MVRYLMSNTDTASTGLIIIPCQHIISVSDIIRRDIGCQMSNIDSLLCCTTMNHCNEDGKTNNKEVMLRIIMDL